MNVIDMFKQAALELQKDELYQNLNSAREMNDKDEELQAQIGEFNIARIDLNTEISKAERDEEKIAKLNEKVNKAYQDIMSNDSMVAYNEAKAEIDDLLQHINAIITTAVNGGDPLTVEKPEAGGCSGSCSSCSGCH